MDHAVFFLVNRISSYQCEQACLLLAHLFGLLKSRYLSNEELNAITIGIHEPVRQDKVILKKKKKWRRCSARELDLPARSKRFRRLQSCKRMAKKLHQAFPKTDPSISVITLEGLVPQAACGKGRQEKGQRKEKVRLVVSHVSTGRRNRWYQRN